MKNKIWSKEIVSWWVSIGLITATGILEYYSPPHVFVSSGYIVALLLSFISGKRTHLFVLSVLAIICIAISFLKIENESQFQVFLLNRTYSLVGLFCISFFVSRFIGMNARANHQKSLMAGIFLHGTQGIILTKQSGEMIMVNPYILKRFGYKEKDLLDKNIQCLFPGLSFSTLNISSVEKKDLRQDVIAEKSDGSRFHAEITSNYFDSSGEVYVATFLNDITVRKQNEETLLQQKKELEIVNQQLEAFSYSVSHDLRSPLRGVGGYATMLREDYAAILDDEANRLLKNIETSALQMGLLIDDLLTFSRIGRKAVRKSEIDMTDLTNMALDEVNKAIKNKAVVLIHPLHHVLADPSLMRQVMSNLLSNAIKYSSNNPEPKIEISSTQQDDTIIFCVKDNGVGFDMNYSHKLFQVFQRLHMDTEFEGTGVGLAIVERIIQKHGGKIWAQAKENVGATFYFSLPIMPESVQLSDSDKELYKDTSDQFWMNKELT